MSRELLFRIWDRKLKIMRECDVWNGAFDCLHGNQDESDQILMQYTGLLDKKGVEIYEGDVVKLEESKWPVFRAFDTFARVQWCEFSCRFYWFEFTVPPNPNGGIITDTTQYHGETEVIGNIHANPELLE